MSWQAWAKALGEYGGSFITDTTYRENVWCAFQCLEKTKFNVLEINFDGTPFANSDINSAYEYPAGFVLFGVITKIQLHSGKIVAYKGK